MAKEVKQTQAQKASTAKRRANAKNSTSRKKVTKKESIHSISPRLVGTLLCLAIFVIFLVMMLKPEGTLVLALRDFVLGLFGKTAFYVSIPAMLYLFVILGFSGNKPVKMRVICLIVFVLLCGLIQQLVLEDISTEGIAIVRVLYIGGTTGTTAGLICGGLSLLLQRLIGSVISVILCVVSAVITLLAAINITVASIVRAIQNRPRAQWQEVTEEREEPAAVVVNHLATKHIEHVEQKRQRKAERDALLAAMEEEANAQTPDSADRVRDMMRQIDDVESPVSAAEKPVVPEHPVDIILESIPAKAESQPVPVTMPELKMEEPLEAAPVLEDAKTENVVPQVETKPETPQVQKITAKDTMESAAEVAAEIAMIESKEKSNYCFPPFDLLNNPGQTALDGTMEMRENARRLNETMASFKIDAHIVNVTRGPSVTRYEVELDKGVRQSKLTSSADDIALSLGASGVRIAAVPDKISVMGIEVPNKAVTTVSLREVIESNAFSRAKSKSSFAVGKDIGGNCIVGNIAKLPHMLIAGTTGSGKSVCMNSIIVSLLYKASPDDVKLIMVDPKMVELGIYNGIPHLLIPVVTDPKKAAGSLQWAVTEMMRRYKAMSDMGVRDLEAYNSMVEADEGGNTLPQIVVIIDELADLMLVAAKEVEESIVRIAQMGRAAGIHLIIATQRPSADVITGLMKANIPSRIAFTVSSAMESRIILDTQGAEKLVGRGDMLYAPIGAGKPMRVQGCFVTDEEVEAVTSYVKNNFNVSYDQQILEEIEKKAAQTGSKGVATASDPNPSDAELDGDEMLPAAVDVILETGQASVSMLQRRLKLGYARAARIVDEMEEKGIVGPFQGSKPRNILITKEQWTSMRSGQPQQMQMEDLPIIESDSDIEE